jgi:hypothetical protein
VDAGMKIKRHNPAGTIGQIEQFDPDDEVHFSKRFYNTQLLAEIMNKITDGDILGCDPEKSPGVLIGTVVTDKKSGGKEEALLIQGEDGVTYVIAYLGIDRGEEE